MSDRKIITGDCLESLKTLEAGSVQCCVTSPPYWGLRDYGVSGQLGLEPTPDEYVAKMVAVFREVRRVLRDDGTLWLNLGDSYASGKMGRDDQNDGSGLVAMRGPSTVSKKYRDGTHERKNRPAPAGIKPKNIVGIPWRVAFALQSDGWILRQDIIWHKPSPMPESVRDRCTKAHEYVFLLAKSERYFYDADAVKESASNDSGFAKQRAKGIDTWAYGRAAGGTGVNNHNGIGGTFGNGTTRNRRSVWTVATSPYKEAHFATFPPKLIEPCVLAGCPVGGVVLDPFAGSGTTGAVCAQHGRKFVGIELNPAYVSLIENRIASHLARVEKDAAKLARRKVKR